MAKKATKTKVASRSISLDNSALEKTDLDILKKAHDSIKQGARGIIFGRNIFMAKNPEKLIKALNDVINNSVIPEEAVKIYGLEK